MITAQRSRMFCLLAIGVVCCLAPVVHALSWYEQADFHWWPGPNASAIHPMSFFAAEPPMYSAGFYGLQIGHGGDVYGIRAGFGHRSQAGRIYRFRAHFETGCLPTYVLVSGSKVWDHTQFDADKHTSGNHVIAEFSYAPAETGADSLDFVKDLRVEGEQGLTLNFKGLHVDLADRKDELPQYEQVALPDELIWIHSERLKAQRPGYGEYKPFDGKLSEPVPWPTDTIEFVPVQLAPDEPHGKPWSEKAYHELLSQGVNTLHMKKPGVADETEQTLAFVSKAGIHTWCIELYGRGRAGLDFTTPEERFAKELDENFQAELKRCADFINLLFRVDPEAKVYVFLIEYNGGQTGIFNVPPYHDALSKPIWERLRVLRDQSIRPNNQLKQMVSRPEQVKMVYHADGPCYPPQYFFGGGAEGIMYKNIHRQPVNFVVANARGAVNTYGGVLGLEVDTWSGMAWNTQSPAEAYQALMLYYFAGVDLIYFEDYPWRYRWDEDLLTTNHLGEKVIEFLQFARTHPQRGRSMAKIGVLRGWGDVWESTIPREAGVFWALDRSGDHNEDFKYLDVLFPKYGGESWRGNSTRMFTGTPYGPVDMLPYDAPTKKLSEYQVIIFLGQNAPSPKQVDALARYVEQGGTLIATVGQFLTEGVEPSVRIDTADYKQYKGHTQRYYAAPNQRRVDNQAVERIFGARVKAREMAMLREVVANDAGWSSPVGDTIGYVRDHYTLEPTGDETTVTVRMWEGKPVVTRRRIGNGSAILLGSRYFHSFDDRFVRELLRRQVQRAKMLDLAPFTDWLEYSVQQKNDSYILCLFNHGRLKMPAGLGTDFGPWKGRIRLHMRQFNLDARDLEVFRVDASDGFALIPVDVESVGDDAVIETQIDHWEELVFGRQGTVKDAFFRPRGD